MNNRHIKSIVFGLIALACMLFLFSFITSDVEHKLGRQVHRTERILHKKQKLLDKYVQQAQDTPVSQWLDFPDFPDDMVLYKYDADTLQSWVNQFSISNDEVDVIPLSYRLHYMSNENLYNTPLSFITEKESYVNLGSAWYIAKAYTDRYTKIITGILVKNEYPTDNLTLVSQTNPELRIGPSYTTTEPDFTTGSIVKSLDGLPLFSITLNTESGTIQGNEILKWISMFLLMTALFVYHIFARDKKSLLITLAGLTLCFIYALVLSHTIGSSGSFFSPSLYADSRLYPSLASLVFTNLYIYLFIQALYTARPFLFKSFIRLPRRRQLYFAGFAGTLAVILFVYITVTLSSLVYNSNITLELFRVTNLTIFTLISYFSYILLFIALLYIIQVAVFALRGDRKFSFFTLKHLIIYILAVTFVLMTLVSVFSLSKEKRNNKVLTNNLAVERDLALEYKLRSIENAIQSDRLIGLLSFMPNGGNEVIKNRLEERYLYDLGSGYTLSVTTCERLSQLIIDFYTPPVDCYDFYQEEIQKYGTQLAPTSSFFFMNNYSGKSSYVGVFTYFNYQTYQSARLFVDIESKFTNSLIQEIISSDSNKNSRYSIPDNYSYAKYYNSRLAAHSGDYNFPVSIDPARYNDGYDSYYENGRVFYINKIADDEIISLSRDRHGIFTYILFYSYLFFISAFIILLITSAFRKRRDTALPVHSFKKRITLMQIISLSAALVCVGIGTVYYVLVRNKAASEAQTDSKIEIVQSSLSEFCQYAMRYNDINSPQLFEAMDKMASNLESEINLYDTHGRLIRSTKPEIFEQFIMGSRINDEAYYNIVKKHASRHTVQEVVAGKKYLSTFAPLFNIDGVLVAIVNIPFITTVSKLQEDSVLTVATIMDIYLLILIASILFGIMVANSISKPLTEVKEKISSFELNDSENKHIYYKNTNDELGVLIEAYNNMVDNLERSTRQLADQERESAWREMARQIAHEIKNPLTPMKLNLQLLMKMKQENSPGWEEKFEETGKSLLQQINILTETAEDFSSFSKFYIEDVTREDLCAILHEQYNFFNTRENLTIEFNSEVENAFVNVRKKQIIRTFINILSNAIQAVENNRNGRIAINLSDLDKFYRVSVEDNGKGVSKKDQASLFKPYFTTKSSGTGLGLAICRSIIEQSNGRLYYEQSETLGGASFIIELPKAED